MILFELFEATGYISEDDLDKAYDLIKPQTCVMAEIKQFAKDMKDRLDDRDNYSRTVGSALFTLVRMHILVHAEAPLDMKESTAEKMFTPPARMMKYIESKGINPHTNLQHAKEDLAARVKKVDPKEARDIMSDYAKKNMKTKFNRAQRKKIGARREAILNDLKNGQSVADVFMKYAGGIKGN